MTNNDEFLTAIFGDNKHNVHVASFTQDPNEAGRREWFGGYYTGAIAEGNQYFTISLFDSDENGTPRRKKSLYKSTHCVVLDDVKEKLAIEQVKRLPEPSWILETSAGSEQWGYILNTPCTNRHKMENLLDGLVANGLAPNGKDPGMKGVTRYVRLPGGYNSKAKRYVDGKPFKCKMTLWRPDRHCTINQLADPFHVKLDAPRREQRIDGAANVPDHPILQHPDIIKVKEVRSDGRFDVRCPWTEEHTGAVDNGAAVFTNMDGSIGFKCHHGSCEGRTGRHLLQYMDQYKEGFSGEYRRWQVMRSFNEIKDTGTPDKPQTDKKRTIEDEVRELTDRLITCEPYGTEQESTINTLVQFLDDVPPILQTHARKTIKSVTGWSESELNSTVKKIKKKDSVSEVNFLDDIVFVGEQNQFFDRRKRIWYTPDAYSNNYIHLSAEVRKEALQGEMVTKVDRLDYAPKMPPVFEQDGMVFANAWHRDSEEYGIEGDATPWLAHFLKLGWGKHRKHLLQWMAYTIRHPENKINHGILLGSGEGCGKDWLLYPLIKAMGANHTTISGEEMLGRFNDHLLDTKHLHVNELEPGNDQDAAMIATRLKPLCAAPPFTLRAEPKGAKKLTIRNIVSVSMTTNTKKSLKLNGKSRRLYAVWSDVDVLGADKQKWREYWRDMWPWMEEDGYKYCIHYLRNCVDLSDFYPREAPAATDMLQSMVEESQMFPNVVSFL